MDQATGGGAPAAQASVDGAMLRSSRHQEWDMMYRAGLTPRRIAELCHAPRSTVALHLQVQRERDPSLARAHATRRGAAAGEPGPGWLARADELARFLAAHGRTPIGTTGDTVERALAQWVSQQRSLERRGRLPAVKLRVLDELPGWRTPGRAYRDSRAWQDKLTGTAGFLAEHGWWPSYKHYKSEHERTLGVWLHAQRQAHWEKTLAPDKHALLDERLPGWSGNLRRRGPRTRN